MTTQKLVGTIIIAINSYYIFYYLRLWYLYEFSDVLFFSMLSGWELVLNLVIGIIGVFIGKQMFTDSMSIVKGTTLTLVLMTTCQIIHLIVNL